MKPSHEIEHPMAVVILGRLVTSTVLNLGLMPALYMAFGRTGIRPEDEEIEEPRVALTATDKNGPLQNREPGFATVATPANRAD
jgi:hypothetical protein